MSVDTYQMSAHTYLKPQNLSKYQLQVVKMSVHTYLKIVFYSYMPSSGHFYFGLTDELRIRDFMLSNPNPT